MFVLPWLIKNWLLTGNPVYPLLDGLFVSPHWSEAQAAMFAAKHAPRFDATGLGEFFERISRYSFSEIGAAPLLLMTVPVLVLFRGIGDRARRAVWLFAGAYLGWYLLTFRPWRFLLPALPLAAMAGAVGLEAAGKWCRIVAIAVILVGFTGMAANSLVDADDPGRLPAAVSFLTNALGQQSRNEFVSRLGHGVLEPVIWMNENLPATAKVLYVGEARTHHARHPVLWSTAFDQHPLDEVARKPVAPERLLARLQALGVTHVYVNFPEWQRLRVNYNYLLDIDNTALRVVLQEHARPVHVRKRGTVWELTR